MILLKELKNNLFNENSKINFNLAKKINQLDKEISDYENSLNHEFIECSYCKSDDLIYYGSYERNVGINDYFKVITIKRVMCKNCGKTHAIIPSFIKPYHIFESKYIDFIILLLKIRNKKKKDIEWILNISRQLMRKWEKRFEAHLIYIKTTFATVNLKDTIYLLFKSEFHLKFYEQNGIRYFSKLTNITFS